MPHAQITAGLAFFSSGRDEKAEEAYKTALALEPQNSSARLQLAKVYNHRGGVALEKNDAAKAEALLVEVRQKLVREDLMTNRNLALAMIVEKRYAEAVERAARTCSRRCRMTWWSIGCWGAPTWASPSASRR